MPFGRLVADIQDLAGLLDKPPAADKHGQGLKIPVAYFSRSGLWSFQNWDSYHVGLGHKSTSEKKPFANPSSDAIRQLDTDSYQHSYAVLFTKLEK